MKKKYELGIIGAGVAGSMAMLKIAEKYPQTKTILFDIGRPPGKRRRQLEGFLGCFPAGDGKLYPSDLEKIKALADARRANPAYNWVLNHLSQIATLKLVKSPSPHVGLSKLLLQENYTSEVLSYHQWKPENIHQLSKHITKWMESCTSLTFNFDTEVVKVAKVKGGYHVITDKQEIFCEKLLLAPGRTGWRWVTDVFKELGLTVQDHEAKFGLRLEISAQYLKEFNKSHLILTKGDLELGPFSWFGTVIPEDHADVVIAGFRSNEDRWKSEKVSFSMTKTMTFENAGVAQADRISKLAFLLLNDRVNKEKIKNFHSFENQINMLPEYSWVPNTITELTKIIPQLSSKGSFHAPHLITQPGKITLKKNLETAELPGLFVAGEATGISGLMAAATMGAMCVESALS